MRYKYIQQLYVTLSVALQNGEVDCKTHPILILRGTDCLPGDRQLNFSLTSVLNIEHWYRCLCCSTINQTSRLSLEKGERWKWIEVWLCVFLIRVRAPWEPAQKVYWLDFCVYGWRNKLNNTFANLCASLTCDYRKTKHASSLRQRCTACRTVFELIFCILDSEILHFASLLEVD